MAPKRPNTRANAQQNKRQKSNPPAIPDEVDAASPAQEEPGPSGDEAGDAGPLEGDGGADEYLGGDRGSVASSSLSSVSSTASRLSPVPSRSPLFSAVRPDSIKPTSARKSQGNTKPYRKAYLITSLSLTADQYAELTQAFANIYEGHLDLLEMNVAADSSAFCDRLNQIGLPANIINFLPVNKGFIMYHAALLGKAAYNARSTKTKIVRLLLLFLFLFLFLCPLLTLLGRPHPHCC